MSDIGDDYTIDSISVELDQAATPPESSEAPKARAYSVRAKSKPSKPGCWNVLDVEIFDETGAKIGEYGRNYSSLFTTFYPFIGPDGHEYALYSKEYTATRVMRLPSCQDVCGELNNSNGFCPTGYYVPYDSEKGYAPFALMCGCVWGDDSSWKVQLIDLRRLGEGIIERSTPFGYVELHESSDNLKLIDVEYPYDYEIDGETCSEDWRIRLPVTAKFGLDRELKFKNSDRAWQAYDLVCGMTEGELAQFEGEVARFKERREKKRAENAPPRDLVD